MKFVCSDGDEASRALLDVEPVRAAGHELVWYDGAPASAHEWISRLDGADGVVLMWRLPRGVLSAVPTVRVVSFAGSGAGSYVPLDEAERCGVTVCNVPHYGANAVAEHAFALAFALARRVCEGDALVRGGSWRPGELAGLELAGRRLAVVGARGGTRRAVRPARATLRRVGRRLAPRRPPARDGAVR